MTRPPAFIPAFIPLALALLGLLMSGPFTLATADTGWGGTWFTCEFARSQTPPDDDCAMFDDEGFRFSNGRFTYCLLYTSPSPRD